jgi:hypothetical protein
MCENLNFQALSYKLTAFSLQYNKLSLYEKRYLFDLNSPRSALIGLRYSVNSVSHVRDKTLY